jgi:predicted nucleotidyltransferase
MRNQLDHLPAKKQRELAHILRVIFEEFEAAHALATQKWKKQGRIFKVVLYGSYARGGWVDDPVGGYKSDYDILIVVSDERLADFEFWSAAEARLMRDMSVFDNLSAPVNLIVHSLTDVNHQLERGGPSSSTSCATASPSMTRRASLRPAASPAARGGQG